MQESIKNSYPAGTLLQQRYLIEDLLGKGGFGAVYLVRDEQDGNNLVALKELRDQDEGEKKRLLFECEILKKLNHPSLPQFKGLFEENNRLYMLMEYIEGQNLEVLRKQQPGNIFPFPQMVKLLQPIIVAVTYLHQQQPPLLHRDIKPANIVVAEHGERTALVDFGIAKEYHADATTTAIRRCTPGYSAPEQYSSMGTDPRVDVYELGATCYTLLTGAPPVDALQRLTSVASRGVDPLVVVSEQAPETPSAAVEAIRVALSLNYEKRFATVESFWQALTASDTSRVTTAVPSISQRIVKRVPTLHQPASAGKPRILLASLLILLTIGLILGLWLYTLHTPTLFLATTPSTGTHSVTPTHTAGGNYPALASMYSGTLDNLLIHTTTSISFTAISQNNQAVRGLFIEEHLFAKRTFSGVVDAARHILVTVAAQNGQNALFFEGVIRADGSLAGNYCSVDAAGQCSGGEYGLWSLEPEQKTSTP